MRTEARRWARAKRTELLTGKQRTREQAEVDAHNAQSRASEEVLTEATFTAAERLLPANLATAVHAHRPEVVAARDAQAYRDELAQRPVARLDLTVRTSDGESGSGQFVLACEVTAPSPGEPASTFTVNLETVDPVALGAAPFYGLTIDVPQFHGPGRYDLAELYQQAEQGSIDPFDPSSICLRLGEDHGEDYLYWQSDAGSGEITVTEDGMRFDLPVAGASATARAMGSIDFRGH